MSPPGLRPMRSRPLGLVPWTCRHRVASKSSKEQTSAAYAALLVVTAWEMASAIRMPPASARSTINQHKKNKREGGWAKKISQNLVPFPFRRMRNEPPSRLAQPSQKTMAGHVSLVSVARGAKRITAGEAPGLYVRGTCSDSSILGTQITY